MTILEELQPVRRVSNGAHHFFGYYDKSPWDASGRYLLGLQVDIIDRMPAAADVARIGMIDLADGDRWIPLAQTTAWGWQQGAMLQWLPDEPARKIIYNQRQGERFVAIAQDVFNGERRVLPRAIYALHDSQALCPNFARNSRTRPGYGYAGLADPGEHDPNPADDGIFWMDVKTGENHLIISLRQLRNLRPKPSMHAGAHWFNHIHIAPDGSNFICLHRWRAPAGFRREFVDRLFSAGLDGGDLRLIADEGYVSHLDYYRPDELLAWSHQPGIGDRYFLYNRCGGGFTTVGEGILESDGHCSFSPDRRWLLTDTYPDSRQQRRLILYHLASETRIDIGRFYAPPRLAGPLRCDLHPRWNRDGTQICIDSAHEGSRQI